jgi:hypothetical protein
MPPIATVGFGLGTANWAIALGALLLFATNLIAIALAAGVMSAVYGFRPHLGGRGWLGHGLVIVILAVLCIPLTISLNTIALESRATAATRGAMRDIFGPKARLTSLSVRSTDAGLQVEGLVATPRYVPDASSRTRTRLQASFGRPADVSIDQVVLADPRKLETPAAPPSDPTGARMQALRDMVPFPSATVAYDPKDDKGVVLLRPQDGLDVTAARALEQGLRAHKGYETTEVVPPVAPLPPITIHRGNGGSAQFDGDLAGAAWALERWGAARAQVRVCGMTSREAARAGVQASLAAALGASRIGAVALGGGPCKPSDRSAPYVVVSAF